MSELVTVGYHFVGATLRDGRPVPQDGEWLEHAGPLVLCRSGLHASLHPFDALQYAKGATCCRGVVASQAGRAAHGDSGSGSDLYVCRDCQAVAPSPDITS